MSNFNFVNYQEEAAKASLILKEEVKDDCYGQIQYPQQTMKESGPSISEQTHGDNKGPKMKGKRRSKNDKVGRNFKWDYWSKTYLSYPALYTHRKLKHLEKMGKDVPTRKIVERLEPHDSEKNPTSFEYFSTLERSGGPIDPLTNFYRIMNEYLKMEPKRSRLYPFLKVFSILDGFAVEDPETLIPKRDYDELSAVEKEKYMSWDEIFSLYLREVSRIVNKETYEKVMKLIVLYRECANKFGWQKKIEAEGESSAQEQMKIENFTVINNAEYLPEVGNQVITEYIYQNKKGFGLSVDDAIDIVRNFCAWLYNTGFTTLKLGMKDSDK